MTDRRFDPVYVIGGQQREDRSMRELGDGWYGYAKGIILRVAPEGVEVVKEYVSRPGTHAESDAVLFKSATRVGDRLYCCTQTEVVVFSLPEFDEINHISISRFNDVHHVVPTAHNTLLVANSGLDTVLELTDLGEVVNEWNVLGEDTWADRDVDVDYRIGVDLKPHRGHPNHVFLIGDEPWASRFEKRDAISVLDHERRIDIGGERVHDGVVRDGGIYFTTVDGGVVRASADSLEVTGRWQLDDGQDSESILGWCRGMCFSAPDQAGPTCWSGCG